MRSLTEILENKPFGSSDKEVVKRYRASKEFQPTYQEYTFQDSLEDDNGNDFKCIINYCYYEHEDHYEGFIKRVVEYTIMPLTTYNMTADSLNTSLREIIRFHAGNDVVFEVGMYTEI